MSFQFLKIIFLLLPASYCSNVTVHTGVKFYNFFQQSFNKISKYTMYFKKEFEADFYIISTVCS
jgi:hypothetical protein